MGRIHCHKESDISVTVGRNQTHCILACFSTLLVPYHSLPLISLSTKFTWFLFGLSYLWIKVDGISRLTLSHQEMLNIEDLGKAYGEFDKSVQAAAVEILVSFLEGQTLLEVLKQVADAPDMSDELILKPLLINVSVFNIFDTCDCTFLYGDHSHSCNNPDTKRVACFAHRQVKGFAILPLSRCILAGINAVAAQPSLKSLESWWSIILLDVNSFTVFTAIRSIRPLATS